MGTEVDRATNAKSVRTELEALRIVEKEPEARPNVKVDKYDGALAQAPPMMPPAGPPGAPPGAPPLPAPPVLALPEAVKEDMQKEGTPEGRIIEQEPFWIDGGKKFIGQVHMNKDGKIILYIVDTAANKNHKAELSLVKLEKEMKLIPEFKGFSLVFSKAKREEMERVLSNEPKDKDFNQAVRNKRFIAFVDQHRGYDYIDTRLGAEISAAIKEGFDKSPEKLCEVLKKILGIGAAPLDFTGLEKIQSTTGDKGRKEFE